MKKIYLVFILLVSSFTMFSQSVEPNWESIKSRPYPQWFSDAKLGIFIHWGLYSVPSYCGLESYGEWYYRGLMVGDSSRVAFQKKNYGEDFEYSDFDKLFKAELFNADEWADLFKRSGAKYVLLVTKHHDGYCLWDSKHAPHWNSVEGGPKRNIVEELTKAVRKTDMKMGFYYSLPEWTNPLHIWMVSPPDFIGRYVEEHMIPQFKELIGKYKPSMVFVDGEWYNTAEQWHAAELISWYYNLVGDEAIVNDRWGHGADYGFRTPEYSAGITQTDRPWAECRGLGRSFALNRNEPLENYITSEQLIRHFAKLVAAGGGMTLNVGPAADGKIPLLQQERLTDLGNWLQINGEAIYGTRPYSKFYEEKNVVLDRIDAAVDFDWVRNSPDPIIAYDNFTACWQGFVTAEFSEKYAVYVEADDAASVIIDGKMIINYDQNAQPQADGMAQDAATSKVKVGYFDFVAGKLYPIEIKYKENTHQASIKLYWESASQEKEIIPTEMLYCDLAQSCHGLKVEYKCKQPYVCYTAKEADLYAIAIEFPQDELILNIEKPSKNIKVIFMDNQEELPWKYKKGQLIINTESIKYNDVKSKGAWTFKITQ